MNKYKTNQIVIFDGERCIIENTITRSDEEGYFYNIKKIKPYYDLITGVPEKYLISEKELVIQEVLKDEL